MSEAFGQENVFSDLSCISCIKLWLKLSQTWRLFILGNDWLWHFVPRECHTATLHPWQCVILGLFIPGSVTLYHFIPGNVRLWNFMPSNIVYCRNFSQVKWIELCLQHYRCGVLHRAIICDLCLFSSIRRQVNSPMDITFPEVSLSVF